MATTWRRDDSLVKLVINAGADDLLARPFSPELLGERLRVHISNSERGLWSLPIISDPTAGATSGPGEKTKRRTTMTG